MRLANNAEITLPGRFLLSDVGRVWCVAERLEVSTVGANIGIINQAVKPVGDGKRENGE